MVKKDLVEAYRGSVSREELFIALVELKTGLDDNPSELFRILVRV